VYNEKPGSFGIKIKKSTENGVDRLSVKPTRFNKQCVDFFRKHDGVYEAKSNTWFFKLQQKEEIKSLFLKDKCSFTLT
jgi:hypothetical protein